MFNIFQNIKDISCSLYLVPNRTIVAPVVLCGCIEFYQKRICAWLGSSCRLRYFNIQKTLHFVVIACCVCLWVFFIERLRGLFVVAVLVIDFTIGEIVCRVCLLWFVLGVFLFGECGD